jgi:carbamoyltransferase
VLRIARHAASITGQRDACLAGGVALNCVANGRLLREGPFERIWIQPASGDAGGAIGAALHGWHQITDHPRVVGGEIDGMGGAYLGPAYADTEIEAYLSANGYPHQTIEERLERAARIADLIADGKVVGVFTGRMEFGPRALGHRSIIGDPRSPSMQSVMNLKIKYRESFRPFAPSVLRERVADYFEMDADSAYMLLVAPLREERRIPGSNASSELWGIDLLNVPRSDIPAVTHIDYSARVQTVHEDTNPGYYRLMKEFEALTGCAVIVNTSFNVRGEPIVCTPQDAYRCFMRTEMDVLVLGNCVLHKSQQTPVTEDTEWRNEFVLD